MGLDPTDDDGGTYWGASSDNPMHCPEFPPVQGMPSTDGRPPVDWVISGEFGTRSGVHASVKASSVSPAGQAAPNDGATDGPANAATAGAAAIATAKPPARRSRRAEVCGVVIATLSLPWAPSCAGTNCGVDDTPTSLKSGVVT